MHTHPPLTVPAAHPRLLPTCLLHTRRRAYALGATHKQQQVKGSLERLRSEMQLLQSCVLYYSARSDLCRQELAGHEVRKGTSRRRAAGCGLCAVSCEL